MDLKRYAALILIAVVGASFLVTFKGKK